MAIEATEYQLRQQRFAVALGGADLPGAVVISRGGSTLDRYADVCYLTGHYQSYSYLPDEAGLFSSRAHTAAVVASTGEVLLCVSVPEYDETAIVADEVRWGDDFATVLAGAMTSLGLDAGRVGLVGSDVLPHRLGRALADRLPAVVWQECDEVLLCLRRIKSPAEQAIIRKAASIHVAALAAARAAVLPGHREADVVAEFGGVALENGAGLYFTALSSGPGIARWTSRALPGFGLRRLESGDLVRLDMGIVLDGYLSDFGRTFVVGEPNRAQRRLLDTLHLGIDTVLAAIAPGRSVRDVVDAGERALAEAGVAPTEAQAGAIHASFPVHWGHGLGLGWERPYMTQSEPLVIAPGMYLAIERTLSAPGVGTAAAEHTLLVGDDNIEILSEGPAGRWS